MNDDEWVYMIGAQANREWGERIDGDQFWSQLRKEWTPIKNPGASFTGIIRYRRPKSKIKPPEAEHFL